MTEGLTIAIDGPAASGKSTIGQGLAERLGYLYFDTGVMYRAVTLAALDQGVDLDSEAALKDLVKTLSIDVKPPSRDDGRAYDVLLNGQDVTWRIRTRIVDRCVSQVSAYLEVREAMTKRQREIGQRGRVVMVGRDIGTVVLPEADLKIYLNASVEERALRRYNERMARGEEVDLEEILAAMKRRDDYDSTRKHAPLLAAEDAVQIDTTSMSVEAVIAEILDLLA